MDGATARFRIPCWVMDETLEVPGTEESVIEAVTPEPRKMPEIQSRFLYVDVSAKRAKQLRRGALPRLAHLRPDPETGARVDTDARLERVAMQEVKEGRIVYEMPDEVVKGKGTK